MKFPLMIRKKHDAKLEEALTLISKKDKIIAFKTDELRAANKTKDIVQSRNEELHKELTVVENKLKRLESYIKKLEDTLEKKTLMNCSLNTKLVAKDEEYKKLVNSNKILIEGFNDANRKNWCNEESKRQLKKLAEDILKINKINKTEVASYLLNIAKYMGGGEPINLQWIEENGQSDV